MRPAASAISAGSAANSASSTPTDQALCPASDLLAQAVCVCGDLVTDGALRVGDGAPGNADLGVGQLCEKLVPNGVFTDVKSCYDPAALEAAGAKVWRL